MDIIPNDITTTASLAPGTRFSGEIESVDDSDWLRLEAVEGQNFWFTNHRVTLGYLFNTKWTFRDSDGVELTSFRLNNNLLEFSFQSPVDGPIYIDISGTSTDPAIGVGTYEITVTDAPEIPGDDSTTTTISKSETIESAFDRPDDVDVIRLDIVAGETYQINMPRILSNRANDQFRILSSEGNVLDSMSQTFGGGIALLFEPTETGTVFLELSQVERNADFFERYTLVVTDPTDSIDETINGAGTAVYDTRLDVQIDTRGDRDWFFLPVTQGETYEILRDFGDPQIALRTAEGDLLASIASQSPTITFTAAETGQVIVDVGASSNFAGTLGITISETDDLANNATTTATVEVGALFTDSAGFRDEDWVALDVVAGQDYEIALTRLASNTNSFIDFAVVDASGTVLAARDLVTGDASLTFSATSTETVYVSFDNRTASAGDYTILVSEVEDPVPGSALTSEVLLFGTPTTVTFERASDVDWYRFDLAPGILYTASLAGQTPGSFMADLKILDLDGNEILSEGTFDREGDLFTTFEMFGLAEGGTVFIEASKREVTSTPGVFVLDVEIALDDALASANTLRTITPGQQTIGSGDLLANGVSRFSDTDAFRFDTIAGIEYLVIVEEIDVFGSLETVSVDDINGPAQRVIETSPGNTTALSFTASETGQGKISVTSSPGDIYSVRLIDLSDDIAGTETTTARLLPGDAVNEALEFADDQDWFRLDAVEGATYEGTLDPVAAAAFSSIAVTSSDGIVIASNAVTGPTTLQFSTEGGELFVQVIGNATAIGNTYTLSAAEDLVGQSVASASEILIGDQTLGTIDYIGDEDWFELSLTANLPVAVNVAGTGGLSSGIFEVALTDGAVLESRAFNSNNPMILSQTTDTSVFVRVKTDASETGSYEVQTKAAISSPFIDQNNPLFTSLNTGFTIGGSTSAQAAREITYSFAGFADIFDTSSGARADLSWNAYEISRISAAMAQFEALIDVDFVEVAGDADITFFAARENGVFSQSAFASPGELGFAFLPLGGSLDGNIVLNTEGFGWDRNAESGDTFDGGLEQFGFGFQTVLHEVGHALGLDHPFEGGEFSTLFPGIVDANGDGAADDVFGDPGSFELSQSAYTVMSYVDGWTDHPFGTGNIFLSEQFFGIPSDPGGHIGTPMALDAAVLQTVYGANQATNAGNDIYLLQDTQAQTTGYRLIWDTGGTDTISYSGARDVVLDLRAATLEVEDGGGGFISFVNEAIPNDPVVGGFAIAHDVQIEVAQSGSGDDALTGNAGANTLVAGAGNDTLSGEGGENTLTGGTGADLFIIADATGNDTITDFALGEDLIDVQALELAFSQLAISEETGGSRVSYTTAADTGSIMLQGVLQADIVESAFIISPTATGTSISGTAGNDDLNGTVLDEQFFGLAGNDTITANAGNDTLEGDAGDDLLFGGDGNDLLLGSSGNDTIAPGTGNDSIEGGEDTGDADLIDYASATDAVTVVFAANEQGSITSGADTDAFIEIELLQLTSFDDSVDASAVTDRVSITAGAGNDSIAGGSGDDMFEGGSGADTLDGGDGDDTAEYGSSSTGVTVDLGAGTASGGDAAGDSLISIEHVSGSTQDDGLTGDADSNSLTGLQGNDTLNGGAGSDVMDGGLGNDRFFVDDAGDVVIEAAGEGTDLISTSVDFVLPDNVENGSTLGTGDVAITGNGLANFITGNGGANHLRGEGGNDRLIAGLGDDTLEGGEGNDILQGQGGSDRFVMGASNGNDQILGWEASTDVLDFDALGLRFADLRITSSGNEALISFDDPAGGTGSVRLVDIDPEVLEIGIMADPGGVGSPGGIPLTAGTSGADNLAATNGDDDVVGLAGNDILNGRAGADTMLGGFGNDRYFLDQAGDQVVELEFQGADQMDAGFSFTLSHHVERGAVLGGGAVDITGNALGNFITGSALSNVLRGEDGRDRLIGFDGEDTLIGGLDNDVMEGGADADLFVFEADSGIDLITDFEVGVDLIDVTALGIAFADMTIIDGALGARVIFDLTPGSVDLVTVQGATAADLRLASFVTVFGENQPPIVGTQGNDVLFGSIEDDELQALGGNDLLDGLGGADLMLGGPGDDRYFLDDAGDLVVELANEGTDQVSSFVGVVLSDNVENGSALGTGDVALTGNALNNALTGNAGSNMLSGEGGADNLQGLAGSDTIDGGEGADVLRGGSDADTFLFEIGDGSDQIIDFVIDVDTIDLTATGLGFADLTITDTGPNATITYSGNTITVFNTTAAQLDQDQFEFGV